MDISIISTLLLSENSSLRTNGVVVTIVLTSIALIQNYVSTVLWYIEVFGGISGLCGFGGNSSISRYCSDTSFA